MKELLSCLLLALQAGLAVTLTVFGVRLLHTAADHAKTDIRDELVHLFLEEIEQAVSHSVAAVNQTYVDPLKEAGAFTRNDGRTAARKALEVCTAALSPAAEEFIRTTYGDVSGYLSTRIEAQVWAQQQERQD